MTYAKLAPEMQPETVKTGLSDDARERIAAALSQVLTDTYSLIIKTHVYHWNVVGPLFHAIHEMTEEQYGNLFEASDEIAERIRALGHFAPAGALKPTNDAIATSSEASAADEMVADLIKDHEKAIRNMREAADLAEEHGDFVSHDLIVERMTYHEKTVWMWRSLVAQ